MFFCSLLRSSCKTSFSKFQTSSCSNLVSKFSKSCSAKIKRSGIIGDLRIEYDEKKIDFTEYSEFLRSDIFFHKMDTSSG